MPLVKETIMANAINSRSHHWVENAIAAPLHGVVEWYRVSQERAEMRQLPADRLTDLGLTRGDVDLEASRPFWHAKRGC